MNITVVFLSCFDLNTLLYIIPDDGGRPSKHVGGVKKLYPYVYCTCKASSVFLKTYPQPLPFGQSERSSFTLTQHNGQIYSSAYFKIYISEWKKNRKIKDSGPNGRKWYGVTYCYTNTTPHTHRGRTLSHMGLHGNWFPFCTQTKRRN